MKVKKFAALLFALVFALSLAVLVTGCGEPSEYTVTYVYNNGEEDMVRTVAAGAAAVEPKEPSWPGYKFLGWFSSEEATTPYVFSTPVNANLTLTARWQKEESEPSTPAARVLLNWQPSEFAEYVTDSGTLPRYVDEGTKVSFSVKVLSHAIGTPVVWAGETQLTPTDSVYTFEAVAPSMTISITGLENDNTPLRGSGTEEDPFLLETVTHLNRFIQGVNSASDTLFNSAWVRLESDLDLNGETIKTIGSELNVNHFSGVFDGNGHTISNFRVESDTSIVGFFGYLVQGRVENLNLSGMTMAPDMSEESNYIVGGVVAYNMGGDVFGCSAQGEITLNFSQTDPVVYAGGICGFVQGYGEDYSGTVSFCTSQVNIRSTGSQPLMAVGGIAGSVVGTSVSAPVNVFNCVYVGNITGRSMLSGGIVGYLRNYASVANCYSKGSVYAQSPETIAAAGGIVGLAETETAVTWSYTSATLHVNGGVTGSDMIKGTVIGISLPDGSAGVDSRQALLLGSYQTTPTGQLVISGEVYDMTDRDTVFDLLGWRSAEWTFENGLPAVSVSGAETNEFLVTFDFKGQTVTAEGQEGGMLSQTRDEVHVTGGSVPIYWIYGGDGRNTFVSDEGQVSFGYFLDEDCTQRIPSAMVLTRDMTVYVGFADYAEAAGEYNAYLNGREVRLVLTDNGRLTQYFEGSVSDRMYVYDGEKIWIQNGRFASLINGEIEDGDYYARISDGQLIIYDGVNLSETNGTALIAYPRTAAQGEWYSPAGEVYVFRADGSGILTRGDGSQISFTFECVGQEVSLNLGDRRVEAVITADGQEMASSDGFALSVRRYDLFTGTWESSFNQYQTVAFDGKGTLTVGEQTFAYTVTGETLTFSEGSASFNEDGLLVWEKNGVKTVMGREGSYIGSWTDSMLGYTIVLEGINRDGYGLAYDTNGYDLTYNAETVVEQDKTYFYLNFWYGTSLYGYGSPASLDAQYGSGEMFAGAFYTPASGMIVDDYNLCYTDPLSGSWNGEDGSTLSFNGQGGYSFSFELSDGTVWSAQGSLTYQGTDQNFTVQYVYDRLTGTASFQNGQTSYQITLDGEGLTVYNGQAYVRYRLPDELTGRVFRSGETLLSFDGRSNVGLGKATMTRNGQNEVYDYTIADGVITLRKDGQTAFTATENQDQLLVLTPAAGGESLLFGLYSAMIGPEWLGPNGITMKINGDFTLDGQTTGLFAGTEATFVYVDSDVVQLWVDGSFLYYLVIQDAQNVGIFDAALNFVNVLTLTDGFAGVYTAEDGSALTLDGRSNASRYVYASAEYSTSVVVGGVAYPERYSYVYEIRDGVIVIFELDRSGEEPQLIEKYRAYSQETEGGVKFTAENGNSLWLVAEEA